MENISAAGIRWGRWALLLLAVLVFAGIPGRSGRHPMPHVSRLRVHRRLWVSANGEQRESDSGAQPSDPGGDGIAGWCAVTVSSGLLRLASKGLRTVPALPYAGVLRLAPLVGTIGAHRPPIYLRCVALLI